MDADGAFAEEFVLLVEGVGNEVTEEAVGLFAVAKDLAEQHVLEFFEDLLAFICVAACWLNVAHSGLLTYPLTVHSGAENYKRIQRVERISGRCRANETLAGR